MSFPFNCTILITIRYNFVMFDEQKCEFFLHILDVFHSRGRVFPSTSVYCISVYWYGMERRLFSMLVSPLVEPLRFRYCADTLNGTKCLLLLFFCFHSFFTYSFPFSSMSSDRAFFSNRNWTLLFFDDTWHGWSIAWTLKTILNIFYPGCCINFI